MGKITAGLLLSASAIAALFMMSGSACRPSIMTLVLLGSPLTAPYASNSINCSPPPAPETDDLSEPANYGGANYGGVDSVDEGGEE